MTERFAVGVARVRESPPQVGRTGSLVWHYCGAAFYAEDRLVGVDPPHKENRAELIRDTSRAAQWLRFSGRIHRRVIPSSGR